MPIDPLWIWIALGAVAVLIVVAVFARGARRARTAALRDQYGREYEHTVETTGSRTKAERELVARATEIEKYDIRPLQTEERDRYQREWTRIEHHFVTRPAAAVVEADELLSEVMRVQGYPIGDFNRHAADLSVKHPRVVEHYRAGHRVISTTPGSASTEDLRQAMLHYRSLFEELLGGADFPREVPREDEVRTTSPRRDVVVRDEDRV